MPHRWLAPKTRLASVDIPHALVQRAGFAPDTVTMSPTMP